MEMASYHRLRSKTFATPGIFLSEIRGRALLGEARTLDFCGSAMAS